MSRTQRGLSLLEVLVAFAIMAMSLAVLYRATGANVRQVQDTERMQQALMLAQSVLAVHAGVPPEGVTDRGESADMTWLLQSTAYETGLSGANVTPLHRLSVSVQWQSSTQQRELTLATLAPQLRPLPGGAR